MIGPGNQFPSRTSELALVCGWHDRWISRRRGSQNQYQRRDCPRARVIPANGRGSAISLEWLAKRFGHLEAVRGGSGRRPLPAEARAELRNDLATQEKCVV